MTPLSFSRWIKQQTWRDDATGDLARDIRFDRCWPRWARVKSDYFNHLRYEHEACLALQMTRREFEGLLPGFGFSIINDHHANIEIELRA